MIAKRPMALPFDFGFTAMIILCCLLCAAVLIVVDGEAKLDDRIERLTERGHCVRQLVERFHVVQTSWNRLGEQSDQLSRFRLKIDGLDVLQGERQRELVGLLAIEKLQKTLTAINRETADIETRINTVSELVDLRRIRSQRMFIGDHIGAYVLLECRETGVRVYPAGRDLPDNPSETQWQWLCSEIKKTGFLALAVRPGGWYNQSFDAYRKRIYDYVRQIEENEGRRIGHTNFPIGNDEPIEPYLPLNEENESI
jgi:hypothetical protein